MPPTPLAPLRAVDAYGHNQMQILPLFSDLILLPRVVDELAHVNVQHNKIHIRSDNLDKITAAYHPYPNIKLERISDTEARLHSVPLQSETLIAYWPSGERLAVSLYDQNWCNMLDADVADSLMAAGVRVHIMQAAENETLDSVIKRFWSAPL